MAGKRLEGAFWSAGNNLYLDSNLDYTGVHLLKHDLCISLYIPKKMNKYCSPVNCILKCLGQGSALCAYFATYLESHQKIR